MGLELNERFRAQWLTELQRPDIQIGLPILGDRPKITVSLMNTSTEKLWQVLGFGDGFTRNGVPASVELCGFVRAPDPDRAWKKAVALARLQSPELTQTDATTLPRAALNCDEIQDATSLETGEDGVDRVELHWARQ